MVISETPQRSNVSWLRTCALLCALVVFPLGTTSAQDYKAVERHLGEAVAKGELSLEQACVMMDALRKAGSVKKEAVKKKENTNQSEAYLMKVKQELGEAVEAGKISKEDAAKKFEIAQKEIKQKITTSSVKPDAKRITRNDYPRAKAELKKAVAKKAVVKKISREDFEQAEAKIRKAIAEGKITKEQGRAKLAEMRKMMGDKSKSPGKKSTDWEDIKRQIEDAVKRGEITRKQADAKYEVIRAKSGQKVKEKNPKDKGLD